MFFACFTYRFHMICYGTIPLSIVTFQISSDRLGMIDFHVAFLHGIIFCVTFKKCTKCPSIWVSVSVVKFTDQVLKSGEGSSVLIISASSFEFLTGLSVGQLLFMSSNQCYLFIRGWKACESWSAIWSSALSSLVVVYTSLSVRVSFLFKLF